MPDFKQTYNPDNLDFSMTHDLSVGAESFIQSENLRIYVRQNYGLTTQIPLRNLLMYVYDRIDLLFSEQYSEDNITERYEGEHTGGEVQIERPDRTNYQTLLNSLLLMTSDEQINNAIISFFRVNRIVQMYPKLRALMNSKVWYWEEFCNEVTYKRRYTFCSKPFLIKVKSNDHTTPKDLVEEALLINLPDFKQTRGLSDIVRCREVENGKLFNHCCCGKRGCRMYYGFCLECELHGECCCSIEFNDLTSPPDKFAGNGRWNPKYISMFYGADNVETARKEIGEPRSYIEGHFGTKESIPLLNLAAIPNYNIWSDHYAEYSLIDAFEKALSKPIVDKEKDYIGTQVFAEHIRYNTHLNVKGIVYRSAKDTNTENYVLFCNQQDSSRILTLNYAKLHLGRFEKNMIVL